MSQDKSIVKPPVGGKKQHSTKKAKSQSSFKLMVNGKKIPLNIKPATGDVNKARNIIMKLAGLVWAEYELECAADSAANDGKYVKHYTDANVAQKKNCLAQLQKLTGKKEMCEVYWFISSEMQKLGLWC